MRRRTTPAVARALMRRRPLMSWHQEVPSASLELADAVGIGASSVVIDAGGGTSRFVDDLPDRRVENGTVLDISEPGLATAGARLGAREADVRWIVADGMARSPDRHFHLWHDRAVLHFLMDPADRAARAERDRRALKARRRPFCTASGDSSSCVRASPAEMVPWLSVRSSPPPKQTTLKVSRVEP